MLTLSKKTWKYIFYAVLALVLLYIVFFSSTREHFTSVNPIPTAADLNALKVSSDKEWSAGQKNKSSRIQITANILKTAPDSVKAVVKFIHANVIPLLPYRLAKDMQQDDGDVTDMYILMMMPFYKDWILDPLAYAVKQQSSPPTLPAFVDMVYKIFIDNAPNKPQMTPEMQGFIDQMKKGQTTVEYRDIGTIPNPGYWGYKYIYGEPKAGSSGSGPGGIGGTTGKCTPSVQKINGGVIETKCFK
jgi:hypothetical protein